MTDGRVVDGTVRNGWFLIPYAETPQRSGPLEIIGLDASGNVTATIDRFGRLTTP